jgi:hypothetical protein
MNPDKYYHETKTANFRWNTYTGTPVLQQEIRYSCGSEMIVKWVDIPIVNVSDDQEVTTTGTMD